MSCPGESGGGAGREPKTPKAGSSTDTRLQREAALGAATGFLFLPERGLRRAAASVKRSRRRAKSLADQNSRGPLGGSAEQQEGK